MITDRSDSGRATTGYNQAYARSNSHSSVLDLPHLFFPSCSFFNILHRSAHSARPETAGPCTTVQRVCTDTTAGMPYYYDSGMLYGTTVRRMLYSTGRRTLIQHQQSMPLQHRQERAVPTTAGAYLTYHTSGACQDTSRACSPHW